MGKFSGMGMMAAFGMGSVLPLIWMARLAGMGWLKFRVLTYRASSLLMIGMGTYFPVKALRY